MSGISSQLQTHLSTLNSISVADDQAMPKPQKEQKYAEIADSLKAMVAGQTVLSPEVSATLLNIIDKLEKAGVANLGRLKTQIATLTEKPAQKAEVPQNLHPLNVPAGPAGPKGPVAVPMAPGAILGDILQA